MNNFYSTPDFCCGTATIGNIAFILRFQPIKKTGQWLLINGKKIASKAFEIQFKYLDKTRWKNCTLVYQCFLGCVWLLFENIIGKNLSLMSPNHSLPITIVLISFNRRWQVMNFPPHVVSFIKIVGTRNTANEVFFSKLNYVFFFLFSVFNFIHLKNT